MDALTVGNEDIAPTYISNSYFSETSVKRSHLYRTGPRSGVLRVNLTNDLESIPSSTTSSYELGSFSGISFARDAVTTIPAQETGQGTIYLIATGNKIAISNYSGSSIPKNQFFRICVPVVLNLDTGGNT